MTFNPRPKLKDSPDYVTKEKKRTPIKQRSAKKIKEMETDQGMLKFFIQIWNSRKPCTDFKPREYATVEDWREHTSQYRVDCVTYEPIRNMVPQNFAHVLSKQTYGKWRKETKNICLMSMESHALQEFSTKSKLIEQGEGGFFFYEYQELLKQEYNTIS